MRICAGEIKGDPDIAGVGVVSALFINAGIAMIFSASLWCYLLPFHCGRSVSTLPDSIIVPNWVKVVKAILMMQGDVQLVTGLSIMIASLVNMYLDDETPLYHIYIARSLADVTFAGYTAAVIYVYPTEHNWTARLILVAVSVGLWEYWSYIALEKFDRWDWETPHCLENDNFFRGEYEGWIKLSMVWMPIGYVPLILNAFPETEFLVNAFERAITDWPSKALKRLSLPGPTSIRGADHAIETIQNYLISLGILAGSVILWAFAILFPASWALGPLQALLSFAWDVYDVAVARASNAHIVVANPAYRDGTSFQNNVNPENDFGFGQILPLAMLLLPLLTYLDLIACESLIYLFIAH